MAESRGTSADSYIGSLISLTSKSEIRYEGILYTVDTEQANIALQNVRSFGTEGRKQNGPQIPPSEKVYDYIIFRSSDIKDLQVKSAPGATAPAAASQPATTTPVEAPPASQPAYSQANANAPSQTTYPPQPSPPPVNNAINPQYGPIPTPMKAGMAPPPHPSYQPPAMWGGPLPPGPNQPPGSNMYWQNYYPAPGLQHPMPRPPIHPQAGFHPSQQPPYHQIPPNYMQQGLQQPSPQAQPGLVTPQTLQVHSTSEQKSPAAGQSPLTQPQNDSSKSFDNTVTSLTRPEDLLNPSVESKGTKPAGLEIIGEPASHALENVQAPSPTARESTPAAPLIDFETEKSVDTVGEVKPTVVTPDLLGNVTSGSIPLSLWNEVPTSLNPKPVTNTNRESKPSPPAATELPQEPRKPTDEPILPLPNQPPQRGGGTWRGGNTYQANAAYSSNFNRRGKGRTSNGIGRGASQVDKSKSFSEDFDFTAMNEKFKKDEVWGELGGKTDKESGKEVEDEGSHEGNGVENEEEHIDETYHDENSQSSKKKMLYRKDDFFDEISCDSLNKSEGRERMRFSEQRKLDSETFGDVKLDPNRNWGYRGGGYRSGGYRGKGRMGGGQSGYGSRPNGYTHNVDRNFGQDSANSYSTSDQSGRNSQRAYTEQGRRGGYYGGQGGSGYGSGRGGYHDSGYTKGRGGYGRDAGGYGDRRGYANDQGGYQGGGGGYQGGYQGVNQGNYGGNETGSYSREGYGGRGRGIREDKGRQGGNRYGSNERYGMEGVI